VRPGSETVMAYVDGELDAPARAAFDAALATDATLRAAVERERALRARLAEAYDPVLAEPLPPALQATVQPGSTVVDLAAARGQRRAGAASVARARAWRWPEWGAMAACLALGTAIGVWGLAPRGGDDLVARRGDGMLVAQGALDRVLTRTLAADADAGARAGIAVGLSFKARDGRYCRTFAIEAAPAGTAGLACRGRAAWELQALAPGLPGSVAPGAYRQAATALPPALLAQLERLRDGDALDADAERAARDRDWR
jgi:anti-sigma factor RsiW